MSENDNFVSVPDKDRDASLYKFLSVSYACIWILAPFALVSCLFSRLFLQGDIAFSPLYLIPAAIFVIVIAVFGVRLSRHVHSAKHEISKRVKYELHASPSNELEEQAASEVEDELQRKMLSVLPAIMYFVPNIFAITAGIIVGDRSVFVNIIVVSTATILMYLLTKAAQRAKKATMMRWSEEERQQYSDIKREFEQKMGLC